MTDEQGVDDTDSDATEQAIAAALVAAMLSTDPSSGESQTKPVFGWLAVLRSTMGGVLSAFTMRVAVSFMRSTGAAEPVWIPQARKRADEVSERVLVRLAGQIEDKVAELTVGVGDGAGPTPPPVEKLTPDEINRRIRIGGDLLAREVVTGARESVRFELATDLGAVRKTWRTRRDSKVRPTHGGLEGNSIPIGQPFVTFTGSMLMFPQDPSAPIGETAQCRCVPGSAVIQPVGELWALARFWWDGGLADVELESGRVLTGTPNHPVLTEHGWVALGQLHPGDNLVTLEGVSAGHPHEHDAHPTVEQVFQSLSAALPDSLQQRVDGSGFDFHGDRPGEEVDVVHTERGLRDHLDPALPEALLQFVLAGADPALVTRRQSGAGEAGHGVPAVAGGVAPPGREGVRFGDAPDGDPLPEQPSADRAPADSEPPGQTELALPGRVRLGDGATRPAQAGRSVGVGTAGAAQRDPGAPRQLVDVAGRGAVLRRDGADDSPGEVVGKDRVVSVRRRAWSGHVYSPSTGSGCYTTDFTMVVSQNCRLAYRIPGRIGELPG